jgi:hypothetical protein
LQSFETEVLTQADNLAGLAALNRELVARAEAIDSPRRIVLDIDSTEIPVYGEQEQSAYNGHFESTCYLLANSNEDDVHAPHWHGQTLLSNSMRTDTVSLEPMSMIVADMVPDNPGIWLFQCHVNEHFDGGMYALFKVTP